MMAWKDRLSSGHMGIGASIFYSVLRFFQLVLALAVVGLYGQYVNNARLQHKYADGKYVYAVVVGGLAALSSLVFGIPFIKGYRFFPWDVVIFILWIALFGIFASMFVHEDPEGDSGIQQMKNAVWVDLVNAILWLITSVCGVFFFFKYRSSRSLHTGRAKV